MQKDVFFSCKEQMVVAGKIEDHPITLRGEVKHGRILNEIVEEERRGHGSLSGEESHSWHECRVSWLGIRVLVAM